MGKSRKCGSYYGILVIKRILHCNKRKFLQIRRGLVKTSCSKLSIHHRVPESKPYLVLDH